jgi:beta-glucosidase
MNEYISQDNLPLYHFGFGLSYTKFSFDNLKLDKAKIKRNGSVKVKVDVTNAGKVEGDEIVQLYIRDKVSSVTRPVKELKGFRRISLKPKETKTVTLEITPEQLAFHNIDMKYVVERGEFEIMVGNSSRDEDLLRTTLVVY